MANLKNAKDYNDLNEAKILAPEAKIALAQPGKTELETADLAAVAGRVSALITDGALTEANAVMSSFKNNLAKKLTDKGATGLTGAASAISFLNAVDRLDVTGSRDFWKGNLVKSDIGNAYYFVPVPGTEYIIYMAAATGVISVCDMEFGAEFPSARVMQYNSGVTNLESYGLSVSNDRTKVAYLNADRNAVIVLHIDYAAWTITVQTHALDKTISIQGPGSISDDGTKYIGFTGSYGGAWLCNLTTGKAKTVTIAEGQLSYYAYSADWAVWKGTDLIYRRGSTTELYIATIDWSVLTCTYQFYCPAGVFMDGRELYYKKYNAYFAVKSCEATGDQDFLKVTKVTVGILFLDTKELLEIPVNIAVKDPSSYAVFSVLRSVGVREITDGKVRVYLGLLGSVDVDMFLKRVTSPTAKGPLDAYEGNMSVGVKNMPSYVPAVLGWCYVAPGETVAWGEYSHENQGDSVKVPGIMKQVIAYENKIISGYLQRNGFVSVMTPYGLGEELAASGALDPEETVLPVEGA